MRRLTVEQHLEAAPPLVRKSMLENRGELEPGAAAVVGRFFSIVGARREPVAAPSAQSFRDAAKSEPTFRTLLRALAKYAPTVSTAGAITVKAEWVAKRPKPTPRAKDRKSSPGTIDVRTWPATWQAYYVGLETASIAPSSLRPYRAAINRCAQLVNAGIATDELNFLTAHRLAETFPGSRRRMKKQKGELRGRTIANYVGALVVLGRYGGADPDALDGVRFVRDHLLDVADAGDKLKYARIADIVEKGGFEFVAAEIGKLRTAAKDLPDHSSEKVTALQSAALCAVSMNKPARTGDASLWRIGEDIVREVDGSWRLAWIQEKTDHETEAGVLWPEVGEILDELILGGRPDRFIHLRYRELVGKNWMTLDDHPMGRRWPSAMVKQAIGIPSQDLRTLAADYLRLHDPETAADVISAHLGHKTKAAGEEYRSVSEGDAAARSWSHMRDEIKKQASR